MKTSRAAQTARRTQVLQLVIAGQTPAQMRAQLALSHDTLTRDLRAITDQLGAWARDEQNRALGLAIAQYQRVIDQAWTDHAADAENERRWLEGEFAEQTQVADPVDGARLEKRTQQQFRSQKADYLRVVVSATQQLCKLCGLEAALKVDLDLNLNVSDLSDAELEQIAAGPKGRLPRIGAAG